jgi:ketosteroid isomerase-like protein
MTSPIETTQALHGALQAGHHSDELRDLLTDDVSFTEYPNLIKPAGGTSGLRDILAASRAGAQLLSSQLYDVHHAIAHGDTAILRLTWTGTVREAAGPFTAGQRLTAHIAQFVTVRDDRISAIATYDCYEPFGA